MHNITDQLLITSYILLRCFNSPLKILSLDTYLFLLLIEVINDHTNEEVKGKEGAEDNEDDEVQVHVKVWLIVRLLLQLQVQENVCYYKFTLLMCITT